ncbi:MAG: hypothetical protein Q4F72_05340 [Desulfovibrionaceae bacterium]|nr:hypothetical protein [Desulfovibrionaceae bacterium]
MTDFGRELLIYGFALTLHSALCGIFVAILALLYLASRKLFGWPAGRGKTGSAGSTGAARLSVKRRPRNLALLLLPPVLVLGLFLFASLMSGSSEGMGYMLMYIERYGDSFSFMQVIDSSFKPLYLVTWLVTPIQFVFYTVFLCGCIWIAHERTALTSVLVTFLLLLYDSAFKLLYRLGENGFIGFSPDFVRESLPDWLNFWRSLPF